MSTTASMTLTQTYPTAPITAGTMRVGYNISVQAKPLDAASNPSGARVTFSSSNTSVAAITPCQVQDGGSALDILGVGVGTAVITATASDTGLTATLTVTVS